MLHVDDGDGDAEKRAGCCGKRVEHEGTWQPTTHVSNDSLLGVQDLLGGKS